MGRAAALLSDKKKPIKLVETVFDILYLSTVFISAALLIMGGARGSERFQFGLMALILGLGDSCHLAPRIRAMWDKTGKDYTAALGVGKLIASITMTLFYVVLWNIGKNHYADFVPAYASELMYVLAASRVALCLFPQNRWTAANPPLKWSILRNLPFFLMGMMVVALFAAGSFSGAGGFSYLWLAVLISFACYAPVVLFSGRNPKLGMLMLPKSCAYAAIVLIGFSLSGV